LIPGHTRPFHSLPATVTPDREDFPMRLTIEPLTMANWDALEDLFGKSGACNGCWCMWPRIGPAYYRRPHEENREELRRLAGNDPSPGLLAFDGDRCVGWCQVAPRSEFAWIEQRSLYGPVDDQPVWAIGCFFVRRAYRGEGVPSALIEGAIAFARESGATILEAYPVDTGVDGHTRNTFQGIAKTFVSHGFDEVLRKKRDRPVMRRELQ
jgi:GNAT superfamily N-acetyltransferase